MYEEIEYDIKPEINGSTKIKIELTDPTEKQEFEEVILEEKYGIGNDHICLLCDIGYPTKKDLLIHIASEHGMKFECSKCLNLFESDFALSEHDSYVHGEGGKPLLPSKFESDKKSKAIETGILLLINQAGQVRNFDLWAQSVL